MHDVTRADPSTTPIRCLLLAVALAAALSVSACGRRGPLEPAPGAPDAPRSRAAEQNMSTVGGSTTFRPGRTTETTANADPDLPPSPQTPEQRALTQPGSPQGQQPTSSQTISSAVGNQTPAAGRLRRSPPPDRAFLLDPLL
jgi:predicted small lipoprotein YifL